MPTPECIEECEVMTSIFPSEISIQHDQPVKGKSLVSMVLYPSTADDETTRFVTLTLDFELPETYPNELPKINFRNPRGLAEAKILELKSIVTQKSEEMVGGGLLYQIRDMVQEFLTANNRPDSECPICLCSFTPFDVFHRTECFHHYHTLCIGKHYQGCLASFESKANKLPDERPILFCPVCRARSDEKDVDVEKLLQAPAAVEETTHGMDLFPTLPEQWVDKRESMKALYSKQKKQGGIIDLNVNRLLMISAEARVVNTFYDLSGIRNFISEPEPSTSTGATSGGSRAAGQGPSSTSGNAIQTQTTSRNQSTMVTVVGNTPGITSHVMGGTSIQVMTVDQSNFEPTEERGRAHTSSNEAIVAPQDEPRPLPVPSPNFKHMYNTRRQTRLAAEHGNTIESHSGQNHHPRSNGFETNPGRAPSSMARNEANEAPDMARNAGRKSSNFGHGPHVSGRGRGRRRGK